MASRGAVGAVSARYAQLRAMDLCPPSAWNGSWDDAQNNPSAAGAVSAIAYAIGAASAHGGRGHTSCKRQVTSSTAIQVGHNHALIALLTVAARDKRAHCNWLEQLQIAEYGFLLH